MLSNYAIEIEAEKIYSDKTKNYFKEVVSSYINGNYRSAIVVLWTVCIYDLILKLEELDNIYADKKAHSILKDIKHMQKANPKSPDWELKLIELISKKMDFFESYEIVHIETLKNYRNISAHPTLEEDNLFLFQPNKETVRALIRNILEILLIKPPLASREIFTAFLKDLSNKKDLFPDSEQLEKYIKTTYFNRMPKKLKEYVFKQLWKFIFYIKDEDCDNNRIINLRILEILFNNNENDFIEIIKNDIQFFSSKIDLTDNVSLNFIIVFLGKNCKIYNYLENNVKTMLKTKIETNYEYKIASFFIFDSEEKYLDFIKKEFDLNEFLINPRRNEHIVKSLEQEYSSQVIDMFIDKYLSSTTFNNADEKFSNLIEPVIKYMNKSNIIKILGNSYVNSKVCSRSNFYEHTSKLKNKCTELDIDFDKYIKSN